MRMSSSSQRNLVSSEGDEVPDVREDEQNPKTPTDEPAAGRGWRFWAVFISLSISAFLSALEGAVVSTALPSISRAVNAGENYIWMVNVFFLTSAAVQPLYSQLADIWGRRWPMITALAIFAVGSGIAGGSNSASVLIGGRTIQGLGAAGINVLVEIIICDLLPLRERGQFMGLMFMFIVLGSVTGPFIGGILVDRVSWRWVFYLNLPFCGLCLLLLFLFLRVQRPSSDQSTKESLKKVDFLGLFILCGSISSLLYALTYGGTRYDWSNPGIIVSFIFGMIGTILFFVYQVSPLCKYPAMPKALFGNRTSVAALLATFMALMVSYVPLYFLPVYFQAVQRVTPERSGVQILPFSATYCVSGLFGGILVSKLGRFKGVHIVSFALMIISLGTFTLLDRNTTMAVWVILQLIYGWSLGMPNPSLLTAVQADIPDSLNAASTGAFAFVRSVATIFAVSVPAAVFGNRFDQLLATTDALSDPATQAELARGLAYEKASREFIDSFPQDIQDGIIRLYELSLQRVWYVSIAFASAGLIFVLLEKNLVTREEKETSQFELQDDTNNADGNGVRVPRGADN
ncbi:major facilitator superfamily domain-containing protein [Hypomontagnella monticulosa]|nr:major facilitator superfamily domain-containing protein [Hypomontagnella monticulosa]